MPAYDRAAPLLEDAGPARTQKGTALPSKPSLPDQRCFNCGSYTHNLQVLQSRRRDHICSAPSLADQTAGSSPELTTLTILTLNKIEHMHPAT